MNRLGRTLTSTAFGFVLGLPAAMAQDFSVDLLDHCEVKLVVQTSTCELERVHYCSADGQTIIRHEILEEGDEPFNEFFGPDYESYGGGAPDFIVSPLQPYKRQSSISELIETGVTFAELEARLTTPIFVDPLPITYRTTFALTGESQVIDNTEFLIADAEIEIVTGTGIGTMKMSGLYYISTDPQAMIGGSATVTVMGQSAEAPREIVQAIRSSENRAMPPEPTIGCGEQTS